MLAGTRTCRSRLMVVPSRAAAPGRPLRDAWTPDMAFYLDNKRTPRPTPPKERIEGHTSTPERYSAECTHQRERTLAYSAVSQLHLASMGAAVLRPWTRRITPAARMRFEDLQIFPRPSLPTQHP